MKSPWFVNHSRTQHGGQRLFCFPYAGGSAHIFRSWVDLLPPSIEVVGILAPGKGSRVLEPPCATIAELVDGLLAALVPVLHEKPFSFFGHSNGAAVAFELSCVLQARKMPMPRHLFLSASPAPWTRVFEQPYSAMNDDEFRTVLKDLNGTPSEILEDNELFGLLLPGLRADFCLTESYAYTHARKLSVPTDVYHGKYDDIEESQIRSWQEQIAPQVRFEEIPGGHFFIHSHLEQLTGLIGRQLAGLESRAPWVMRPTTQAI